MTAPVAAVGRSFLDSAIRSYVNVIHDDFTASCLNQKIPYFPGHYALARLIQCRLNCFKVFCAVPMMAGPAKSLIQKITHFMSSYFDALRARLVGADFGFLSDFFVLCCGGDLATTSIARSKRSHASVCNSAPFFDLNLPIVGSITFRKFCHASTRPL
jgi:hypothetical protein